MKHRWLIVALALVAASAFALSVEAREHLPWWDADGTLIGPFGSHSRFAGDSSLAWAGGVRWVRFGAATGGGALIAMLVLILVAGAVAAGRKPRLAARTALVAIATAVVAAIAFVVGRPDLPMTLGIGPAVLAAAAAIGVPAALLVLRSRS